MASAAVDSPHGYPESPLDGDDVVYPCKGCGEILEEGKAFELAGNRWHIDCFRCNTCSTLLDSDANLLLLGDGSLICNNCTYSCNACGNKIEDLAILTGDQAFCSGCFRCRNCKRKIENLRYARTSQGIFCMSCHESLMARRRKKSKAPKQPGSSTPTSATTTTSTTKEKALPSLPPGVVASLSPDVDSQHNATSETNTPQPRSPHTSSHKYKHDASPMTEDGRHDGQTLPSSIYGDGRNASSPSHQYDDDETDGFLPMLLDPSITASSANFPAPPITRKPLANPLDNSSPQSQKENVPSRDYFPNQSRLSVKPPSRSGAGEAGDNGLQGEQEREQHDRERLVKPSPHILSQDKSRLKKRNGNNSASQQQQASEDQDSDMRRTESRSTSRADTQSPMFNTPGSERAPASPGSIKSQDSAGPNPFNDPRRNKEASATPVASLASALPPRGASLAVGKVPDSTGTPGASSRARSASIASSGPSPSPYSDAQSIISRDPSASKNATDTPASTKVSNGLDPTLPLPPRSASRPGASTRPNLNDDFTAPRAPPAVPPAVAAATGPVLPAAVVPERPRNNTNLTSINTTPSINEQQRGDSLDGGPPLSPSLLGPAFAKFDAGFSLDDEMGRILRGDAAKRESANEEKTSVLRRVSNAVKHGRSFSERSNTTANGGRTPLTATFEASTPTAATAGLASPASGGENVDALKASLRRAQSLIAHLEADKLALEEQLHGGASEISAVNTELREKRSTMAVLDTQREMVVRELEVLTNHLARAKDARQPLDLAALKTSAFKELAENLQKLKDSMAGQIADLMHKRNELTDEIGSLIQMKDKGFQEYENLSTKNNQLLQHNSELLRNIQGVYHDNRHANGGAAAASLPSSSSVTNGLGIYSSTASTLTPTTTRSDLAPSSQDPRSLSLSHTDTMPQYEGDADSATVLTAPQVVNIRKAKFNWRRGGEKMAKNVTKGIKGAFVQDKPASPANAGGYSIGLPYSAVQTASGGIPSTVLGPAAGGVATKLTGTGLGHVKDPNGGAAAGPASTDGSVLFGSELAARCDFEGRLVPHIVTRCVAQVERRGMTVEGVYRKSGGAGQVKSVQQGFEKDNDFDLADEDLDIHAVTSALKQYFRKLPTPLIVYDVYDLLLDAGQINPAETTSTNGASESAASSSPDSASPDDAAHATNNRQILALRHAVRQLPEAHRNVLQFLLQHLANVMAHEPQNLMTPLNLAVVFAPTIMRPQTLEREMSDMQAQRMAIQALLEHQALVFVDE